MLSINPQNISGMIESQRQKFVIHAMESLRIEFPELWLSQSDSQIKQLLYDQCERAKYYNINLSESIYKLFTMRLRLDWRFPEGINYAWAREILLRDLIPEDERIGALEAMLWGEGEN